MKILIADDHALFRDGLALRLEKIIPDSTIIQASDYTQVLKMLKTETPPDILILDIDMQHMPWSESTKQLKELALPTKIIVVSASEDSNKIRTVLAEGVKGYIPKRSEVKVFNNAIKLILDGGTYIPPNLLENHIAGNGINGKSAKKKTLTNRQSQVLNLIAEGKSNKQIAYDMGVSESTVKLHINALLRSLHVNNRTQAVVTAQKIGIL